ncbi:hypothetical protein HMPREF1508_1426 [Shuttleworthella sp. MSX8B]|nr:hypothetical protein HMPREF1508_1426 [Shuttleworthia sp. MSX8B]
MLEKWESVVLLNSFGAANTGSEENISIAETKTNDMIFFMIKLSFLRKN